MPMASRKKLAALEKLREFFRSEVQTEVRSGFARLARVPDTHVIAKMRYYSLLGELDKLAFLDCCAHWASSSYGFVVGACRLSPENHPFFLKWSRGPNWYRILDNVRSVPLLRTMVQQYKIDRHNKIHSHVTRAEFRHASSIRSVKAREL